jgi:hypothetical protein
VRGYREEVLDTSAVGQEVKDNHAFICVSYRGRAAMVDMQDSTVGISKDSAAVVLRGWRKGMDKAGVTLLLRNSGGPLAEAHEATNSILRGEPVSVRLPKGTNVRKIRRQLDDLGVIL